MPLGRCLGENVRVFLAGVRSVLVIFLIAMMLLVAGLISLCRATYVKSVIWLEGSQKV